MADTDNKSGQESPSFTEGLRFLKQQYHDGRSILSMLDPINNQDLESLTLKNARKKLLEKYWQSFQERHLRLTEFQDELEACQFYKQNKYHEVQEAYLLAVAALSDSIEKSVNPPPVSTSGPQQATVL